MRDAVAERARRYLHADRTAHRSADPAQRADLELVDQGRGERRIKIEAIFLLGRGAPLAQAPTDRVRADDAITIREMPGEIVEIPAGARQAVPHHDRVAPALAPFDAMQLAAEHGHVLRSHAAHCRAASLPKMPAGKK